jgi:hypothetical protein
MGLLLTLVPPKRTGGYGRSKGLPNKLMGYVIECLVEAYILLGARGRLTTARPDSDVDHKDFIVDLLGGYRSLYLQVKGSASLHPHAIFVASVDYAKHTIRDDPRLLYVFCQLDIKSMSLARIWLVPAADFRRLAPKIKLRNGRTRYTFTAGKTGKWARYEIDPLSLGARLIRYMHELNGRAADKVAS